MKLKTIIIDGKEIEVALSLDENYYEKNVINNKSNVDTKDLNESKESSDKDE